MTKTEINRRELLQRGVLATAGLVVAPHIRSAQAQGNSMPAASQTPGGILATLKPEHPRLIASSASWEALKKQRARDPLLDAFLKRGEVEARAILTVPPLPYKKEGKRLLSVSRVILRRVLLLAMQYHLTGYAALAKRAQEEMLNAAAFADWNPIHFLDVGEMTTALAFGYDWLYQELEPGARKTIADAIIKNGLRPGLKDGDKAWWWQTGTNNWNQVCLGGLSLGALAVAESDPALATQILEIAKKGNPYGLKVYEPAGVYPEGAMYWGYGTTFQVVLLSALESALGTDWGLSQSPGFLQTADALFQTIAPSGAVFNFSDGTERPSLEGGNYWFAQKLKRPDLVSFEKASAAKYADLARPANPMTQAERLRPLTALWWPDTTTPVDEANVPRLNWYGPGPNALAVFRSGWDDPKAMYLALKAGSPSLSHAHMDAGSFVFEASGVRWACDLGMQDYLSLESKGVDLWNGKQDGERWKVFRLGPFSHNTLTINDQLHHVDGTATITHFGRRNDFGAIVDMTPLFAGQATRVTRGFVFRPNRQALIRDEIEGLKAGDVVRFAMLTRADIAITPGDQEAILSQDGQKLRMRLNSSVGGKWEVVSAEPPANGYDAPNPGFRLLVARLTAPASGSIDLNVNLQPLPPSGQAAPRTEKLGQVALAQWGYPPATASGAPRVPPAAK